MFQKTDPNLMSYLHYNTMPFTLQEYLVFLRDLDLSGVFILSSFRHNFLSIERLGKESQ